MIEVNGTCRYLIKMKAFNLGDLIRFFPDSQSECDYYGVVISKKKFNDNDGTTHNFLTVLWSDGGMGYIRDDLFEQIEVMNSTGSAD